MEQRNVRLRDDFSREGPSPTPDLPLITPSPSKSPLARAFTFTWLSSASSTFGLQMAGVAYPLLALQLGYSPVAVAWVSFAWMMPNLLFHIPAGALVDRWDRRRIMMFSEAARFGLITTMFITLGFERLEFHHLIAIVTLESSLSVFYTLSETTRVPDLVEGKGLTKALARNESVVHLAVMAGRPLGGLLFSVTVLGPFIANFVLCFISLIMVGLARKGHTSKERRPARSWATLCRNTVEVLSELRRLPYFGATVAGLAELRRLPYLRTATALTTVTNIVCSTVLIIFISHSNGLEPWLVGFVMAATGVGGVLGSAVVIPSQRAARRLIRGPQALRPAAGPAIERQVTRPSLDRWLPRRISMLLVHLWLWMAATVVLLCSQSSVAFLVALLLMGFAGGRSNVTIRKFAAQYVHRDMLGRVTAVTRLFGFGAAALGPLIGGLLADAVGTVPALWAMAATLFVLAATVTFVPSLRRWFFKDNNLTRTRRPQVLEPAPPFSARVRFPLPHHQRVSLEDLLA